MRKYFILFLLLMGFLIPSLPAQAGTPFLGGAILYKNQPCGTGYPANNDGATSVWTDNNLSTSSALSSNGCAYGGFGTKKNIDGYMVRLTTGATSRNMTLRLFDINKNLVSTINGFMEGNSVVDPVTPTNAWYFTMTSNHSTSTTIFEIELTETPDITPPSPPVLSASGGNMQINLSWTKPGDIDLARYQLFRSGILIATITNPNTTTYTDQPLTPGNSYNYTIIALDDSLNLSNSSNVATATATDTTPPTTPTNLVTNAIDNGMSLSWFPSTDNHTVSGYQIFVNGSLIQTVTTTSATVNGLLNGTSYNFSVKAIDAAGNVSAAIAKNGTPQDNVSPIMGGEITAGTITDDSIQVYFPPSLSADVAAYQITRNNFSTIENITHTPGPNFEKTFTGLSSGASYTIKVRAVDDDGNLSAAKSIVLTTTTTAPGTPAGLLITELDNKLSLSWTANSEPDLAGYKIYLVGSTSPIATITAPTTGYDHNGLANGVTKSYQITAFDTWGNESPKSGAVSGTPVDMIPPFDVATITTESMSEYEYTFRWDPSPSSDVAFYKVYKDSLFVHSEPHTGAAFYTYTASGLTPGVTYNFKVNPVDDDGNELTTGTIGSIDVTTIGEPPSAPTGLTATADVGKINLSWNANSEPDFDSFNLYIVSGGVYSLITSTDATTYLYTTSSDEDITFSLAAVDDGGSVSVYSSTFTIAALPSTPSPLFAGVTSPISANDIVESGFSLMNMLKWILLIGLAIWLASKLISRKQKIVKTFEEPLNNPEKIEQKERQRVTSLKKDLRNKMSKSLGYKIYKK